MADFFTQYGITMPMAFFAMGILAIILDILLIGEATLLSIGIGAVITSAIIGLSGIENIYTMLLIFAGLSLLTVFIMKKLIVKKEGADINDY